MPALFRPTGYRFGPGAPLVDTAIAVGPTMKVILLHNRPDLLAIRSRVPWSAWLSEQLWPSGYNAEEMGTASSGNSGVVLILLSLALF